MRVRMDSFEFTEQDRRAVRFINSKRKTMCSRKEAQEFIEAAVDRAMRDLRYRWYGPQVSEAVLNGADPEGVASHEKPAAVVNDTAEDKSDSEVAAETSDEPEPAKA